MDSTELKQARSRIKGQVTRIHNFFEANPECSTSEAEVRLTKLEEHWNSFERIQQKLESLAVLDGVETATLMEENEREQVIFEDRYYNIAAKAKSIINEAKRSSAEAQQQSQVNQASNAYSELGQGSLQGRRKRTKLPEIKLPEFNGEYTKWLFFKNSFETTIHNDEDLTESQKYQYLTGVLTGEARDVVASFKSEHYENAWQLLKDTYDNEMMIIETHLDELFEFPPITKENKADLIRQFIWHIQTHRSSLKALHQPVDHWDTIIVHLAKRKLDYIEQRDWQESTKGHIPQDMPKLEDFIAFLTERCHTLRTLKQGKTTSSKPKQLSPKNILEKKPGKKVVLTSTSLKCKVCEEAHQVFKCNEFLKLNSDERKKRIMEKRLCLNCLGAGHQVKECKASTCKKCSGRHNTLLHPEEQKKTEDAEVATTSVVTHCANIQSMPNTTRKDVCSQVILSTAQVYAQDVNGERVICRALLDSGSQSNVMTASLLQRLGLPSLKGGTPISGIGQVQTDICKTTRVSIKATYGDFEMELECLVLPSITEQIPQRKIEASEIVIPKGIRLADPAYQEPGAIDLLIGAGPYWKLLIGPPRNRIGSQPALQNTKLGWIIGGNLPALKHNSITERRTPTCLAVTNDQLHQQMERFWRVEDLPETKYYTTEEKTCEKHFVDTSYRNQEGRFVVCLPTRDNVRLGESREQAQRRLEALERRFQRNPELKDAYCDFMKDYEQSGHMTRISESKLLDSKESYFIPHQAVVRPDSLTTKLRVVFDASAKTSLGTSLNDKLMPGPNLQNDIFKILIRFRIHQYVITADIAQMFRQILIDDRDRLLQLILWRDNSKETPSIYHLNTVTYGTASAPYHAMRCLRELAIQFQREYPMAARAVNEDFYMDDLLSGGDTQQEVTELQRQSFELLQKGQFHLRKWRSNEPHLIQSLLSQQSDKLLVLDGDAAKTLGLLWCSGKDTLQYEITLRELKQPTKRTTLSSVSQIFDPLGLIGPILIRGKILMQKLWVEELEWDQPIPALHLAAWNEYYESLSRLNLIQLPRNVNPHNSVKEFDLVGFGDASQKAFGACVYVVNIGQDGNINSHLLCAKSKVAPLKTLSLPRLELEAALLLAQLCENVKASLQGRVRRISLWSDSTIVLGWLKTEPHALKTFVANRVAKIQELTRGVATWQHVPSEENPADLLSRGTTVDALKTNSLWWHGPAWIKEVEQCPRHMEEPDTELPERKMTSITLISTQALSASLLLKWESFGKLCRIIAYCFRFITSKKALAESKANERRRGTSLSVEELIKAEKALCRWIQREEFASELKDLRNNQALSKKSQLKSLSPFLDNDGLIRVGGRLRSADLSDEQKHPIVLPSRHRLAFLIMKEEHERLLHCPPEQLLHNIRQRYWPIHGRRLAQRIVRTCIKCFRYNPTIPEVRMGDLPKERVTVPARPFMVTGVDYAGPLEIRESRRRGRIHVSKGYIALFVCFSTKAVHLEIVTSLTTEAFLAALSRFTARRGLCTQLFSDNATNFVGASRELQDIQKFLEKSEPEISSLLAKQKINWSFIPPRSPHFRGLWESAVKIMKRHLCTITQGRVLTYEEYNTLITGIEAVLNSRPLTPLTNDPTDLKVLTPSHFLIGDSLVQPVQHSFVDTPDNQLSHWQHLQKLRQQLWQRWQKEYLQELQKRSKWLSSDNKIELNTLVLLMEDKVPPLRWPLGRIIAVHPGADGQVRVATVRTQVGSFKRAVKKMCPLPVMKSAMIED